MNPASWLPLAAGASSRNLAFAFSCISVLILHHCKIPENCYCVAQTNKLTDRPRLTVRPNKLSHEDRSSFLPSFPPSFLRASRQSEAVRQVMLRSAAVDGDPRQEERGAAHHRQPRDGRGGRHFGGRRNGDSALRRDIVGGTLRLNHFICRSFYP